MTLQIFNTAVEVNYTVIFNVTIGVFFGIALSNTAGHGISRLMSIVGGSLVRSTGRWVFPLQFYVARPHPTEEGWVHAPPAVVAIPWSATFTVGGGGSSWLEFQIIPDVSFRSALRPAIALLHRAVRSGTPLMQQAKCPYAIARWLYPETRLVAMLVDREDAVSVPEKPEPSLPKRYQTLAGTLKPNSYYTCRIHVAPKKALVEHEFEAWTFYEGRKHIMKFAASLVDPAAGL